MIVMLIKKIKKFQGVDEVTSNLKKKVYFHV